MISYSIAPSVFEPPDISFIDNSKKTETKEKILLINQIIELHENIKKIKELIDNEDIIVLLFNKTKITFDVEYMKKANRISEFPIDKLKIILNKLQSYYLPDNDSNDKINLSIKDKYFTFEDWFKIDKLKYENIKFHPSIQTNKDSSYDNKESIIKIGIINNYIFKSSNFHFLINKQTITYKYECKKIQYNKIQYDYDKEETINKEFYSSEVQVKNISEIKYNKNKKNKSVLEAYKLAKKLFYDYIIFGNDVEKGIKSIEIDAGPPDRIFTYLQTLKEFTEYKRKNKDKIPDDYILTALGCICSYEKPEHMQDEKVINDRMYDNGNKQKILFELHLKPSTNSLEGKNSLYGTVRIYISWNEEQEKVIVGWIGRHPYLPEKNLTFPQSSHYNMQGEPK
jgi:hypothetical protein